jgi:hypothetical protein
MNFKLKIQIYIERNHLDNYLDGSVRFLSVREICGEPTVSRPSRRSLLLRRSTDFGGHGRLGEGYGSGAVESKTLYACTRRLAVRYR